MQKYFLFSYSLLGYLLSLTSLTFFVFWLYPWNFFPYYIDIAIISINYNPFLVNSVLLILFGMQHSLMARESFKNQFFFKHSQAFRSTTYCTASAICLILLMLFWQPIPEYIWHYSDGLFFWILTSINLLGWTFALISTFMINHFELFGLYQGYRLLKNLPEPTPVLQRKFFYKLVRHPVQLGTLIGIIITPTMSYSHLFLGLGMSIYTLLGLYFEEKDLVKNFGKEYLNYQRSTPMIIPFFK